MSKDLTLRGHLKFYYGRLAFLFALACVVAGASPSPTVEFDSPYQLRIMPDGVVLELSGSFSWALPQNFAALLATAPQVRIVRLDSPGGHVKPALEVAAIIRRHGLDTYVGRSCASACTVAFLGGRQRWLAPDARLGFHQAHAPGIPPAQVDGFLREAYEEFAVPAPFIARVLRTPPGDLWFPDHDELRAAGFITGPPPAAAISLDGGQWRSLRDIAGVLQVAPDGALIQFATALSDLLGRLQEANPEACWTFTHDGSAELRNLLPQTVLDAASAAEDRVAEAAKTAPVAALGLGERKLAAADLIGSLRATGQAAALDGLRSGADHAAFCPSLRALLQAALAFPESRRARALRAVFSGG